MPKFISYLTIQVRCQAAERILLSLGLLEMIFIFTVIAGGLVAALVTSLLFAGFDSRPKNGIYCQVSAAFPIKFIIFYILVSLKKVSLSLVNPHGDFSIGNGGIWRSSFKFGIHLPLTPIRQSKYALKFKTRQLIVHSAFLILRETLLLLAVGLEPIVSDSRLFVWTSSLFNLGGQA